LGTTGALEAVRQSASASSAVGILDLVEMSSVQFSEFASALDFSTAESITDLVDLVEKLSTQFSEFTSALDFVNFSASPLSPILFPDDSVTTALSESLANPSLLSHPPDVGVEGLASSAAREASPASVSLSQLVDDVTVAAEVARVGIMELETAARNVILEDSFDLKENKLSLWDMYVASTSTAPVRTKCATGFVLFAISDALTQVWI
jgi:hypothetical protein